MDAEKVLSLADNLEDHRLFVGWPFPELELDPKAHPEEWGDRPRKWVRVLERQGNSLLLDEVGVVEALGCDWYIYFNRDGRAVAFACGSELPEGYDQETAFGPQLPYGQVRRPS